LLKGLSINPLREYEFAVACGDQYVRVFDVRRGDQLSWKDTMVWVTPPHLAAGNAVFVRNRNRSFPASSKVSVSNIHTTFVEFSGDGGQIVVTYHGENVYVFGTRNYDCTASMHCHQIHRGLMEEVGALKAAGNAHFRAKAFSRAIECYHDAIHRMEGAQRITECAEGADALPLHALYCNLALALFQRLHFNDLLMALFCCDRAIEIQAGYKKAFFLEN